MDVQDDAQRSRAAWLIAVSGSTWMCAALVAATVAALKPMPMSEQRLRRVGVITRQEATDVEQPKAGARIHLASAIAAFATWMFFGGAIGVVAGLSVFLVLPVVLRRLEPKHVRIRRQQMVASAPIVADLLSSCLSAGSSINAATQAVAQAVGEPMRSPMVRAVAHMGLAADPGTIWAQLGVEPGLDPIARAIRRSNESGAPLADILLKVAEDLRSQRRTELESAAKSVGVRAVAPLGLCFLPAFLLLGVVPLVASLVQTVLPQ